MKHPKSFLTVNLLLMVLLVRAQDYNPYKSIGKKAKVLTASKGKYVEVFDYDTIQRIGSVLINTRTKKVVRLLDAKKTFQKGSNNTSASRWYSPDPLASKYASLSPYVAMANNPIFYTDKDGREITPGQNWTGSAYEATYNKLHNQASFKQLTQRFEGNKDRNVNLNLLTNDPTPKHSYGRTKSDATLTSSGSDGERFVNGEHKMSFFSAESQYWNKADFNSLGQAAVITHEFLHANSYYEMDNNDINFNYGPEASLAYGGYLTKMQGVLKDFVKENGITGVTDLDIKAISAIGIGIQDSQREIIGSVASIVTEYAKTNFGVTLDATASDYGQKLVDAYKQMRDDVSSRLLVQKK